MTGDAFHRFEQQGWERAAGHYEAAWSGLTRQFVRPLVHAVGISAETRLLDLCCGPGFVSEEAARLGAETLGIDFSSAMVARARDRCPTLEFRVGDARKLELSDESFDAVIICFGVNHFADPQRVFAEAARVLRPAGRMAFSVWARPELCAGIALMREAIERHADLDVPLPEGPDPFRFVEPEECARTLAAAGHDPSTLSHELLQVKWQVPEATWFFEAERDAGVRTAGLLAVQSDEVLQAIRRDSARAVEAFASEGGYAIPMAAHVIAVAKSTR